MLSKLIEATNHPTGINWGKFLVMKFGPEEWAHRSSVNDGPLLRSRGWTEDHVVVFDVQTGEGGIFYPGGMPSADLDKHKIWVCPMFEPFLKWLYHQDLSDLSRLPPLVEFTERQAPSAMAGYRRKGSRR